MTEEKLPDRIKENFPIMSQNGREVIELVRRYNVLPVGDPQRKPIYQEIKSKVDYEANWE